MSATSILIPIPGHDADEGAGPQPQASAAERAWPSGPSVPQAGGPAIAWSLIDLERYEVRRGAAIVGFVDVVGHVFVVLAGDRYDHAVELAQRLDFDAAVDVLATAA
jgi:hypothetical protein